MKRILQWCMLIALFGFLVTPSCSTAPNPAGVPAPPVEVPSPIVLKFIEPEEFEMNIDALGSAPPSASVAAEGKFTRPYGCNQDGNDCILAFEAYISRKLSEEGFFIPALSGLSQINPYLPSECVATFEKDIVFTKPASAEETGTYLEGAHNVKIDFRLTKIDLDGKGPVACSGTSCLTPGVSSACAMMWIDGAQYIVWRFDEVYEPDVTLGKGSFKMLVENVDGKYNMSVANSYEQKAVGEKQVIGVEQFLVAVHKDYIPANIMQKYWGEIDFTFPYFFWHYLSYQEGPDESALKALAFNIRIGQCEGEDPNALLGWSETKTNVRFVEGQDLISGSLYGEGEISGTPVVPRGVMDVCQYLCSCDPVAQSMCEDVAGYNLRTYPIENTFFPEPATDADVAIPADFPATPTF